MHVFVTSTAWQLLILTVLASTAVVVVAVEVGLFPGSEASIVAGVSVAVTFGVEALVMIQAYGSVQTARLLKGRVTLVLFAVAVADLLTTWLAPHYAHTFHGALLGSLIARFWLAEWPTKLRHQNSASRTTHCLQKLIELRDQGKLIGLPMDTEDLDFVVQKLEETLFNDSIQSILESSAIDTDQGRFLTMLYSDKASQPRSQGHVLRLPSRRVSLASSSSHSMNEECDRLLESIDEWKFDIFRVDELTHGHALATVAMCVFNRLGLLETFSLSQPIVTEWLHAVERAYLPNPYHTATHAADVLQAAYYLLQRANLVDSFSALEIFALTVSAIIHDLGHIGVTNNFLKLTSHPLAILHNDQSILEHMHASEGWKLCVDPKHNIFSTLSQQQLQEVRSLIIDMVLDTDMAKHAKMTSQFSNKVNSENPFDVTLPEDRRAVLCMLLHVADLSNGARPFHLSSQWSTRVMEEFFRQGDQEKALALPVTPNMDRDGGDTLTAKCQMNFLIFLVFPLYSEWCGFLRSHSDSVHTPEPAILASRLESHISSNIDQWKRRYLQLEPSGKVPPMPVPKSVTTFPNVRRRTWTVARKPVGPQALSPPSQERRRSHQGPHIPLPPELMAVGRRNTFDGEPGAELVDDDPDTGKDIVVPNLQGPPQGYQPLKDGS